MEDMHIKKVSFIIRRIQIYGSFYINWKSGFTLPKVSANSLNLAFTLSFYMLLHSEVDCKDEP
jgi:hypothetical protein